MPQEPVVRTISRDEFVRLNALSPADQEALDADTLSALSQWNCEQENNARIEYERERLSNDTERLLALGQNVMEYRKNVQRLHGILNQRNIA